MATNGVDFVLFQMTRSAKRWWNNFVLTRPAGLPAFTWDQFSQIFLEKFLPVTLREYYCKQFERLQQGSTISVCNRDALVLFDSGSTYSYVSSYFALYLVVPRDSLSAPVYVSTLMGDAIVADRVYRSCVVIIGSLATSEDLLLLDMVDFDVILGMDWLSPYHVILDCHVKTVTLALPGLPRLE
ncbi:uncharacterized protein [Nicotiana tomentosiformis]|uniref:uncharacterized protein n=1 Tax=Nicotiana tomentosiformis TaxID=4098 RepID=UPI00388CB79F